MKVMYLICLLLILSTLGTAFLPQDDHKAKRPSDFNFRLTLSANHHDEQPQEPHYNPNDKNSPAVTSSRRNFVMADEFNMRAHREAMTEQLLRQQQQQQQQQYYEESSTTRTTPPSRARDMLAKAPLRRRRRPRILPSDQCLTEARSAQQIAATLRHPLTTTTTTNNNNRPDGDNDDENEPQLVQDLALSFPGLVNLADVVTQRTDKEDYQDYNDDDDEGDTDTEMNAAMNTQAPSLPWTSHPVTPPPRNELTNEYTEQANLASWQDSSMVQATTPQAAVRSDTTNLMERLKCGASYQNTKPSVTSSQETEKITDTTQPAVTSKGPLLANESNITTGRSVSSVVWWNGTTPSPVTQEVEKELATSDSSSLLAASTESSPTFIHSRTPDTPTMPSNEKLSSFLEKTNAQGTKLDTAESPWRSDSIGTSSSSGLDKLQNANSPAFQGTEGSTVKKQSVAQDRDRATPYPLLETSSNSRPTDILPRRRDETPSLGKHNVVARDTVEAKVSSDDASLSGTTGTGSTVALPQSQTADTLARQREYFARRIEESRQRALLASEQAKKKKS